ncbi:MAG: phytanoyl-CoA dioxygenase family protein [Alphaproteobacteria bacterium]|nr:phytanoyl-CoA dioxygenase family protein [Alphaproteobacteria bacterium]
MAHALTDTALEQYREEGYFTPITVLDAAEVAACRDKLEMFEATQGGSLKPVQRSKSHLLFKWVDDLIRDPRIADPMEQILGPDILCWNTLFWIKEAHAPSFVTWHQDINYWGLAEGDVVSAWLAFSPATEESGCMRVLPRSHTGATMTHEDRHADGNMLTRGQEIADAIDERTAVHMPLRPGEMSIHDVRLAHASGPNGSDNRRIGLSMHFMPTKARQSAGAWDSAALVRGADRYGHFHLTPRLSQDFDPPAVAFHEKAADALREILYRGDEAAKPTL